MRIRKLAVFIGNVVVAGDSVHWAPLKYKYLEVLRNEALKKSCGDFDALLCLVQRAKCLIHWWINNIHSCIKSICTSAPDLFISTDASLSGWGACIGSNTTGGHWAEHEKDHINILELKAVLFGLKALLHDVRHKHIRIKSDNTTVLQVLIIAGALSNTC